MAFWREISFEIIPVRVITTLERAQGGDCTSLVVRPLSFGTISVCVKDGVAAFRRKRGQ